MWGKIFVLATCATVLRRFIWAQIWYLVQAFPPTVLKMAPWVILFFASVAAKLALECAGEKDGADFSFEGDVGAAVGEGFCGDVAELADADPVAQMVSMMRASWC